MSTEVITTGRCLECAWRRSTAEHIWTATEVTRATEKHGDEHQHATFVEGMAIEKQDVA
ncbi:hypothetical protein [Enterococcus hirae]|uniref:hypothetical protein n=1 Tax=Enterococcus hirae TaxID=1354 RepID=UPI001368365C|nr:hypothetical protein [Enterococcus hirae]NAE18219.1 hypothetical protein [Enterococcus hirae]